MWALIKKKNMRKISFKKNIKIYGSIVFILLAINVFNFGDKFKDFFGLYGFPVKYISNEFLLFNKQFFSFLGRYSDLEIKYFDLKEENAVLKAEIGYAEILEDEVNSLKEELKFEKENEFSGKLVEAQVLKSNSYEDSDKIFINKGYSDGINEGNAVFFEKIFIGIIERANKNYSIIRLPNSNSSNISVQIVRADGMWTEAVAKGNKTSIKLENISNEFEFLGDEIVIINDLRVKRYAVLGNVQRVIDESSSSYKEAYVQTLLNYKDLRFVYVEI